MTSHAMGRDLAQAVAWLQRNRPVAIPTETVYGLAGNAFSSAAVAEIFAVKNRPRFDPLIVHIGGLRALGQVATQVPPEALILFERFSPGPLTVLLPKAPTIPDLVTSGQPRVAVRIPHHPLAQAVLAAVEFPLAAPSANPFGYVSPTTAQHVADQLGTRIPYILDGGPCGVGVESTIVGFEPQGPVVWRPGGVPVEALEEVLGAVTVAPSGVSVAVPGGVKHHYAPGIPLYFDALETCLARFAPEELGFLAFTRADERLPRQQQWVLSPAGDLAEAAQALFAALRWFDGQPLKAVAAEAFPEQGLGRAINDRLRRASAKLAR